MKADIARVVIDIVAASAMIVWAHREPTVLAMATLFMIGVNTGIDASRMARRTA